MTATLSLVPVEQLTTGAQLFRCVPYNCGMLARSCVTRQAQADSAFPPAHLMLCKGCELGREVKRRAADVDVDPHAGARASRKHMPGVPLRAPRSARSSLPIIGLELAAVPSPAPAVPPPAFTTKPPQLATKNEEPMSRRPIDIEGVMVGKEIAGVIVLAGLPSQGAGQLCRVRFPQCGHEDNVLAFSLNSNAKTGRNRRCKICQAVKSGAVPAPTPEAQSAPRTGSAERPAPSPALTSSATPKTYEFPLRRDFVASLVLPENLTAADVYRLTRLLDALVFEDDTVAAE